MSSLPPSTAATTGCAPIPGRPAAARPAARPREAGVARPGPLPGAALEPGDEDVVDAADRLDVRQRAGAVARDVEVAERRPGALDPPRRGEAPDVGRRGGREDEPGEEGERDEQTAGHRFGGAPGRGSGAARTRGWPRRAPGCGSCNR